ncbi:MAG TPA: D-alanine--D-alanine ligase [Candidatus Brocadiaceae bacterium]
MKPKNVVVLMGGISSEREISLRSGNAVANALINAGFNVTRIDVKDKKIEELGCVDVDVAFIALHGCFGEDGGVQQLLESKGILYTGSGVKASKLAMDKLETKQRFIEAGLKTPDYITAMQFQEFAEIEASVRKFSLPVIIKPTKNGSSIGISVVRDMENLRTSLKNAFEVEHEVLIERYIQGREFTVGILDDKALPIIEIKPATEFFNYEAKYKDDRTKYLVVEPALEKEEDAGTGSSSVGFLPPLLYCKSQQLAVNAHRALDCRGFSRVDLMMDDRGEFYLLEVNTIPGFTEKSLLPKAAKAAGMTFPELCEKIVELAFQNFHCPTAFEDKLVTINESKQH